MTASARGRSRSAIRRAAWSTACNVWTQTSPSGCHSGSCGVPSSATNSGSRRGRKPQACISARPSDGRRAWSSSFSISPHTRSAGSSSSGIARHSPAVAGSTVSSKRAASCTARSARSGSSTNVAGSTARSTRAARSARPPCGSSTSPVSGSNSSALSVKSRRRAASSIDRRGSPTTAMPRCPGPTFESRRGTDTSTGPSTPSRPLTLSTVNAWPTASTWPSGSSARWRSSGARPKTSTSKSFTGRPSSASRTAPPTISGRPPCARTASSRRWRPRGSASVSVTQACYQRGFTRGRAPSSPGARGACRRRPASARACRPRPGPGSPRRRSCTGP